MRLWCTTYDEKYRAVKILLVCIFDLPARKLYALVVSGCSVYKPRRAEEAVKENHPRKPIQNCTQEYGCVQPGRLKQVAREAQPLSYRALPHKLGLARRRIMLY